MNLTWCVVCCTRHSLEVVCPGDLLATGAERHGWRVNVETPRGIEAYGVLVAPSGELWRARILTYPNVLWLVPGGRGTIKFVGRTPAEAERQAADYIREHCRTKHYLMRTELEPVDLALIDPEATTVALRSRQVPSPRKIRFLPVRFGVVGPTERAGTGNLSETGLFIITDTPVVSGSSVQLVLELSGNAVQMSGRVVWMRREHHAGRSPGMGIRLDPPPSSYLNYVRALY